MDQRPGGEIAAVTGVAQQAGVQPGDRLLAVDGQSLRDVIDFRFYADGPVAVFNLLRGDREMIVHLSRPAGADWGVEFVEPLFDGIRRCTNRCLFCFLDQLPRGWRQTLYLRDDDYRLSFLHGNFVTLSNLREEDWERIEEQHLGPLYVSVHATEPALRRLLFGRQRLPDIRRQLAHLGRLGLQAHTQVVLCPGINDGPHLERTLADLDRLAETVRSVALVPVGLTRFRTSPHAGLDGVAARLCPYSPSEAAALLHWARPRQRDYRDRLGRTFLYLSDEFYLLAGKGVPAVGRYDGFPQLENGVGLVRQLLDDWARVRRRLPACPPKVRRVTVACGTMIAPLLRKLADQLQSHFQGLLVQVLPVENVTLGPQVTVSGLLTAEALRRGLPQVRGEILFLPRVAFSAQGHTLDDVSVQELQEELGRPIVLAERLSEVVGAL